MLKDKKYLFVCRECGEDFERIGNPDSECPKCKGFGKCVERTGTCDCGSEVEFSRFTNTCHDCGADYNMSGERLASRDQWGEETGETASDIISVDSDSPLDDPEDLDYAADDGGSLEIEEDGGDEPVGELSGKVMVQVDDDEPKEFNFTLPLVPGADNAEEIEDVTVDEDDVRVEQPKDMLDLPAIKDVMPWISKMFSSIPKHTGVEVTGIERAISYLENFLRMLSRIVRMDLKDELDINVIEKARDEVQNGIDRLEERLEKLQKSKKPKKKAESENGVIVKEAQKIMGVHGVVVTVPLLISRIARVCINGMVSGGHDIEDLFDRQVKAYDLTVREQAELLQLLEDTGYPMRRDRGFLPDEENDNRYGYDWNENFHA